MFMWDLLLLMNNRFSLVWFLPSTFPDHLNASHLCLIDSAPFVVYSGRALRPSVDMLCVGPGVFVVGSLLVLTHP